MFYGIVNEDGTITAPVSMRSTYNGIKHFHLLTDEQRSAYGWHRVKLVNYDYDPYTQRRLLHPACTFDGEIITCEYTIVSLNCTDHLKTQKALKLAEINRECDLAVSQLALSFPQTEVQSWDQQVREADMWTADNNAVVPLITAIASVRGVSLQELVSRIHAKATAFAGVSGSIIGKRQYIEDQLYLITDDTPDPLAAVHSLKW